MNEIDLIVILLINVSGSDKSPSDDGVLDKHLPGEADYLSADDDLPEEIMQATSPVRKTFTVGSKIYTDSSSPPKKVETKRDLFGKLDAGPTDVMYESAGEGDRPPPLKLSHHSGKGSERSMVTPKLRPNKITSTQSFKQLDFSKPFQAHD